MDFLNTQLGRFLWLAITGVIFIVLLIQIFKSAVASWKRTGKISSIFDEIIEGIAVVAIYIVIIANPATTILSWISTPIIWFLNLIKGFITQITGMHL